MLRTLLVTAAAVVVAAAVALASTGVATAGDHSHPRPHPQPVQTGFQVLAAGHYATLRGQRVGVIANPTSVLPDLRHEVDVMHGSGEVSVIAVFGPEHGFRGTAQAGGSEGFYNDPATGLPVYDLYAKTVDQMAAIFAQANVDTLVFDIQEIGTRYYTYLWTMYQAMKAAAIEGKRFVVLDRPAPLGGTRVGGPVLDPHWSTFVGLEPIPQQYGMTIGELAKLFNAEYLPKEIGKHVDLTVIVMRGWTRDLDYDQTGLPWVPPSPNIPTLNSAYVYPGLGLFEGTNLSEGRGTTRPFEEIGAPYVDYRWAQKLNAQHLPGVTFREAYFAPTFSKFVGLSCAGVQLYVTDRKAFDPIRTAVAMMITAKNLYPTTFAWRYDTGDKLDPYWVDKLSGSDYLRTAIDKGETTDQVVAGWQGGLAKFMAMRAKYLIYPDNGGH